MMYGIINFNRVKPDIRYSHFSLQSIKDTLTNKYTMFAKNDFDVILWNSGFNLIYLVTKGENSWIFRLRPSYDYYDLVDKNVEFVLKFQDYLFEQSFPVPKIMRTIEDKLYGVLQAPEGHRYYSLHEVVPGQSYYSMNKERLNLVGGYLATMHEFSQVYNTDYKRLYFTREQMLTKPSQLFKKYENSFTNQKHWFNRMIETSQNFIDTFSLEDFVIIHGDFWYGNILVEKNDTHFIDFDFGCYAPKELDLASFLILGLQKAFRDDKSLKDVQKMFEHLLFGYEKIWGKIDYDAIVQLSIIRTIWTIGGYLSAIGIQTRNQIQKRVLELMNVVNYLTNQ